MTTDVDEAPATDTAQARGGDALGLVCDVASREIPLCRLAQPADLANAVAFLASDEAACLTARRCRSAADCR